MAFESPSVSPAAVAAIIILTIFIMIVSCIIVRCSRSDETSGGSSSGLSPDSQFLTIDKFLNKMESEKPIRFTDEQLKTATDNFTNLVGMGGFGAVYKGMLGNGTTVAVKLLHGSSDKRIEEQFMAEVSTIGRVHHFNLVRLYGFCFERNLRALVYEYMGNGSLDRFLFDGKRTLTSEKLHQIAVGVGKGIAYLHEDCQQRIIHYDIKPGNVLLDENFHPKVADFGLAKLCDRENTHITMTGGRGTPGYAAPELWMPFPVTYKCDVYSYGMLLFEIIGRRRNLDINLPQSQEWFPKWVWKKLDNGELAQVLLVCRIEEKDRETAQRLLKTALWCVQYSPESRPLMSIAVKMLEGSMDIPMPLNPFPQLMERTFGSEPPSHIAWTVSTVDSTSSSMMKESTILNETPIVKKHELELSSST